jgi:C4-dicarboxylate-specific signal transduction histidine kinase
MTLGTTLEERAPTPRTTSRLARRSIQLALVATLVALLPLVLLARLTTTRAQDAVRDEVAVRLRVTTAMSAALLAEQLAGFVTLIEAEAKRPTLVRAVAGGDPARFDDAEIRRELAAVLASRDGLAATGLFDLDGVLRSSPVTPELVGKDFSGRDYYKGLVAAGDTYVSEAFESAQAGHPFVVTIATYVRAQGKPLAIIVLAIELDAVQPLADSVAAVQGVNLWVADQRGKLLAAPTGRPSGLRPVAGEPIGRAASLRAGRPADLDLRGEAMLVVHRRVDPLGWTVFAAIPHAEAYRGVEAIRTISRIETGSLALSLEAVDLLKLLTETADLIRPLAAEREISIQPPSPEDCSWTVHADRQRLKQVLLNRASNAVEYNHRGGSIRLACHAAAEGRAGIVVQDSGPGIPADRMERLFVPFDRLGAEQTEVEGTGLGLALSKGLMEAMGGTLTAHSVQARGPPSPSSWRSRRTGSTICWQRLTTDGCILPTEYAYTQ